jgi:hypothetical protein
MEHRQVIGLSREKREKKRTQEQNEKIEQKEVRRESTERTANKNEQYKCSPLTHYCWT